jgi:hypothetical protein
LTTNISVVTRLTGEWWSFDFSAPSILQFCWSFRITKCQWT